MLKTDANPDGRPIEVCDGIRKSVLENRSQFYLDLTLPFFGFNREGAAVSDGTRQEFWREGMQGGIKRQFDCTCEFSDVDFSEDLKKINVPTLVVHDDDDQIVPIDAAGRRSAELVPNAIGLGDCTSTLSSGGSCRNAGATGTFQAGRVKRPGLARTIRDEV